MCKCTINCTDVVEIKELMINSTEALYTGSVPIEEFTTEKGKKAFEQMNEAMKKMGVNNMKELFDYIVENMKDLHDIDINLNDFMPQRIFIQPLVGETNVCIAYSEVNDIVSCISTGNMLTKFVTSLVVRENGKWLLDSKVS